MVFARISCIALGFLLSQKVAQAQADHFRREIQKIITFDAEIDFLRTPGLMVGLVLEDTTHFFSFGVASREDSASMEKNSIFEIGELTQVFTAAAVVELSRQGYFDLDSSLTEFLGLEVRDPGVRKISIRQCLNHTSGLPRYPPFFGEQEFSTEAPYATYSKEDLLNFLMECTLDQPPPLPYGFSNMNYACLELIVEKAGALPFEEIMEKVLFHPFGMDQTRFTIPEKDSARIVQGYNQASKPVSMWNLPSHNGAFGLKSTPEDLTRFMEIFLSPEPGWAPVFSELYRDPVPTGIRKNTRMGLGWHLVYPKKHTRVLVHTGSTAGYMAYMAMAPDTKTGVLVLANSPYGSGGLGLLVLRMINRNWKLKGL